jgi:hypothetical protein
VLTTKTFLENKTMATRTYTVLGKAYGSSPVTIQATVSGSEEFNGTVTTVNAEVPDLGSTTDPMDTALFTFTGETSLSNEDVPVTLVVSGGTAVIGLITADKLGNENSVTYDTNSQNPLWYGDGPAGSATIVILGSSADTQAKQSVTIDGEAVPPAATTKGENAYAVDDGSTMTFMLKAPKFTPAA